MFKVLKAIEETALSLGVMAVALLAIINVASRTFFGESLSAAEELIQFLMIMITFIGTSYAASQGRHIRMSAFYDMLSMRGRRVMMIITSFVTGSLLWTLAFFAVSYAHTLSVLGTKSPVLGVAYTYIYWLAPIGLFMAGLQYFMTFTRNCSSSEVYFSYTRKDLLLKELGAVEAARVDEKTGKDN